MGSLDVGDYLRQGRIPSKGPLEVVTSSEQHIKSVNNRHFRNTFQRPWIIPSASEPLEKNARCSPLFAFFAFLPGIQWVLQFNKTLMSVEIKTTPAYEN